MTLCSYKGFTRGYVRSERKKDVIEHNDDDRESYSEDVKARVEMVFLAASQVSALKNILTQIKAEAVKLRNLFLTDADQTEIQEKLRSFDTTMQESIFCISKYLEAYQASRWSEIIDEVKSE